MTPQEQIDKYGEEFPAMAFPVKGGGWWLLLNEDIDRLQVEFTDVDVPRHCGDAFDWAFARKSRHKTRRGMAQFLRTWLGKQKEN